MFPVFLIIQRYGRSTPIIAKCGNDREPGTGSRSFWETIGDEAFFMKAPPYLLYVGKEKKLSQVDRSTEIRIVCWATDLRQGGRPASPQPRLRSISSVS
jgi:hypothetical protein